MLNDMKLSNDEKNLIREYGSKYFNADDLEAWLNIDLRKTNQMRDYMRYTAASAYLDAVRAELDRREREDAKDHSI